MPGLKKKVLHQVGKVTPAKLSSGKEENSMRQVHKTQKGLPSLLNTVKK